MREQVDFTRDGGARTSTSRVLTAVMSSTFLTMALALAGCGETELVPRRDSNGQLPKPAVKGQEYSLSNDDPRRGAVEIMGPDHCRGGVVSLVVKDVNSERAVIVFENHTSTIVYVPYAVPPHPVDDEGRATVRYEVQQLNADGTWRQLPIFHHLAFSCEPLEACGALRFEVPHFWGGGDYRVALRYVTDPSLADISRKFSDASPAEKERLAEGTVLVESASFQITKPSSGE